jgi:AP-1-like factor
MAGSANDQQFNPAFLSQNQQDLLMAALASNQAGKDGQFFAANPDLMGSGLDYSMSSVDPSLFLAANGDVPLSNFDISGMDEQQFMDIMDSNGTDLGYDDYDDDQAIDAATAPSAAESDENDIHDKRKSPEDDNDDADPKRREGDDKTAKKPGRKPLTTEPTTVCNPLPFANVSCLMIVTETQGSESCCSTCFP